MGGPRGLSIQQRLDRWTERGEPLECWPWKGAMTRGDYGILTINHRKLRVPRLILSELHGLDIDGPWVACHTCDNRSCANPAHLYPGTHGTNTRDAMLRGRTARGERIAHAKLTEESVQAIRSSSESGPVLAARYGIGVKHVSVIRTRKAWAWLD